MGMDAAMKIDSRDFIVAPGSRVDLDQWSTNIKPSPDRTRIIGSILAAIPRN
jgi:hypothetical protein